MNQLAGQISMLIWTAYPLAACALANARQPDLRKGESILDIYPFLCPWCNELNDLPLDPGESGQQVVVDCGVCCRPIEIELPDEPGEAPRIRAEGQ